MPRLYKPLVLLAALLSATPSTAEDVDVWIGTATPAGGLSRGVYHLTLDDQTGKLSEATLAAEAGEPGFLAQHPTRRVLYATSNDRGGSVTAWRIEANRLTPLGSVPTGAGGPCHVAVDPTGGWLFSAQYGSGSACSYRLNEDGSIAERASIVRHTGPSGVNPARQRGCFAHWVGPSPDNRFLIVPDLGADRVFVHRFDAATGGLSKHSAGSVPPGGGPRHFKFHPSLSVGYAVNELTMALTVFDWNADRGELAPRQTIPTLTAEQLAGEPYHSASEVRIHPSGRFVYVANRGHDSITAFAVDPQTGELSLIETESIRGSWPRNFNLDPSGHWLLAAGRDSNTLAVFAIDPTTGALRYARETAYVPAPICVMIP